MIALPRHISPGKHGKQTLIPLVLVLAITVAGLVEPGIGLPFQISNDPKQDFAPVGHTVDASARSFQRNTK